MGGISEEAIRKRAYDIWEREGRPHGRDFEHWVRAQVELAAEVTVISDGRTATQQRPRAVNAKVTASKASRPAATRNARAKKA
jgi:Protein of unknown function (DUF2934)